jgi:hypothetical protein
MRATNAVVTVLWAVVGRADTGVGLLKKSERGWR